VIASEQLLTVLVTSAVPTLAVLIGILVNDLRLNEIVRAFDADNARMKRTLHKVRYVRQAGLNRPQR